MNPMTPLGAGVITTALKRGAATEDRVADSWCSFGAARSEIDQYLLYDPQTSGGLLIALSGHQAGNLLESLLEEGERACLVGKVISGARNLRIE